MSWISPDDGIVVPKDFNKMSFPQKLHQVLSRDELSHCISWLAHGRAFRVIIPKRLELSRLLNDYFGYNCYSTFVSQLMNHGFQQITQGEDKNSFYHEVRFLYHTVDLILARMFGN